MDVMTDQFSALQLNVVSRDELIEAMKEWVLDKHKRLEELFVERQSMSIDR